MDNIKFKLLNRKSNYPPSINIIESPPDFDWSHKMFVDASPLPVFTPEELEKIEHSLNGVNFDFLDSLMSKYDITISPVQKRGQISVRPETQVMAQHSNTSTSHHNKPASSAATSSTSQYIVLNELVKRAVQKEWLELDYGASWWSNDHAPTIYANSKLIPTLNSFLSNRWPELQQILKKRPVAAKKIRLKKTSESSSSTSSSNIVDRIEPPNHQQLATSSPMKSAAPPVVASAVSAPGLRQIPVKQVQSSSCTQTSSQEPLDLFSLLNSPPDVKPVYMPPALLGHHPNQQNLPTSGNISTVQSRCAPSMPELKDPAQRNYHHTVTPEKYEIVSNVSYNVHNVHSFSNGFNISSQPSLNNSSKLIDRNYLLNQQLSQQSLKNHPSILTPQTDNNPLKMKIKLNKNSVTKGKPKCKKVGNDLNKEKKPNVEVKSKKVITESQDITAKKKRKKIVRVKYAKGCGIKKCSVLLHRLSEEKLRKYTGLSFDDVKRLYPVKKKSSHKKKAFLNCSQKDNVGRLVQRPINNTNEVLSNHNSFVKIPLQQKPNSSCTNVVPSTTSLTKVGSVHCSTNKQVSPNIKNSATNDVTITAVNSRIKILSPNKEQSPNIKSPNLTATEKLEKLKFISLSVTCSPKIEVKPLSEDICKTIEPSSSGLANSQTSSDSSKECKDPLKSRKTLFQTTSDSSKTSIALKTTNDSLKVSKDSSDSSDALKTTNDSLNMSKNSSDSSDALKTSYDSLKMSKDSSHTSNALKTSYDSLKMSRDSSITNDSLKMSKDSSDTSNALKTSNDSLKISKDSLIPRNVITTDSLKMSKDSSNMSNPLKTSNDSLKMSNDSSDTSNALKTSNDSLKMSKDSSITTDSLKMSKDSDTSNALKTSNDSLKTNNDLSELTCVVKTEREEIKPNIDILQKQISSPDKQEIALTNKQTNIEDTNIVRNKLENNRSRSNELSLLPDLIKRRALSSPPHKSFKPNTDYLNGKIIPLGQKSCQPIVFKRRSSEGSFELPLITNCISLAPLGNEKSTSPKIEELEKASPLNSSNKDNETILNDMDSSTQPMDMNMNYKMLQKPLANNNPPIKNNKLKEINLSIKESDDKLEENSDSNKENTYIEKTFDDSDLSKRNNRKDEEPPMKKARIDGKNDETLIKTNLKIDLSRMRLEDESANETEDSLNGKLEIIEREIMELPSTSFKDYNCGRCKGVFVHITDWKKHYDDGHPKCANFTAQKS